MSTSLEISVRKLFNFLLQELVTVIEDQFECSAMVWQLLGHYLQLSKSDWITNTSVNISIDIQGAIMGAMDRLKKQEPIQYVLGEVDFAEHIFKVTPDVLIPRPETEEWVTALQERSPHPLSILDIGTGSGCIAITLQKQFPQARVDAIDISEKALDVAAYNAKRLEAAVNFIQMDILRNPFPIAGSTLWSWIVSNPPYIGLQEKVTISSRVVNYEPSIALFVNDVDPLLFYKRIIALATHHLYKDGMLCLEINALFGEKIVDLLQNAHFKQIALHQDILGRDRWVIAFR